MDAERDVLLEIAQFVRGAMREQALSMDRLGSELDDFGFVEITLSHGLTKRLFEVTDTEEGDDGD